MEKVLKGKEVSQFIREKVLRDSSKLRADGVIPTLAVVRAGNSADDIAYEKSIIKACSEVGIEVKSHVLEENISHDPYVSFIKEINENKNIHGYMVFRPLPKQLDEKVIKHLISPRKDIECMNPLSLSRIFEGETDVIVPCTAAAVIEMLKYYGEKLEGRNIVVIGRSLVVGRPLSMMLLKEDATVTICHSKTHNLAEVASKADILIAAAGKARFLKKEYVKPGAVVIDVGINTDENGKLCGDVDYDDVFEIAGRITPVPGGVGAVTTAILLRNLIKTAKKQLKLS